MSASPKQFDANSLEARRVSEGERSTVPRFLTNILPRLRVGLPPSVPSPEIPSDFGRSPGRWRLASTTIALAIVWLILAARLIELQWFRNDEFSARAERIQTWTEPILARPGDILDRAGRLLATTTTVKSLFVDPSRVTDPAALAARLSTPLSLDAPALATRIKQSAGKRFLWVKRRLTPDEAAAVRELRIPFEVAGFRDEYLRHYPQGAIAAHVIGLRGVDNAGRGGAEEGWNGALQGTNGERVLRRDARGFVLDVLDEVSRPPVHGGDVTLTIDVELQRHIESRLDALMTERNPRSAAAIVMDPATGEVLAMGGRPAFDPNDLESAPADCWRNPAISSIFEPGSTFKPLVVGWALDAGVLTREELIDCEGGAYRMGRRVLHDHHGYGSLSVTDVLVKSSNIGMARIGERLLNPGLRDACVAFGFGRTTGCGLPGELPGLLRPLDEWTSYSTGSIPMGQEIAVTPLQLAAAHAALANGGRWIAPRVVQSISSSASTRSAASSSAVTTPLLQPETAAWLVQGPLVEVIRRGTGKEAALAGYTVFGKTGTSQVADAGSYSHSRHICSFVCGAPAEAPRAVVLVMVEEPEGPGVQYGGVVAAPVARGILADTLAWLRAPPNVSPREERLSSDGGEQDRH